MDLSHHSARPALNHQVPPCVPACGELGDQSFRCSTAANHRCSPREELSCFLNALFEPTDLIEVRAIETWVEVSKKQSRLVERHWLTPTELLDRHDDLRDLNERLGANIFFGVNPRWHSRHGRKDSVARMRCLWADLDDVTREQAGQRRERSGIPQASIEVCSGSGIHYYWLLDEPLSIATIAEREHVESTLKELYRALGSDHTQDVGRILRLPGGFLNVKDFRNGAQPRPCSLLVCDTSRSYRLSAFEKWKPLRERKEAAVLLDKLPGTRNARRIRGLVNHLTKDVPDRSRRDFAVVLGLLRLGCSPDEVALLVENHSKFLENENYLQTTIRNAMRQLQT